MKYKIHKEYIIQEYEDNKIILDPDTSEITILNDSAWIIFSNIVNAKEVEDIIKLFAQGYPDEEYEVIKGDVLETVDRLKELRLICDCE